MRQTADRLRRAEAERPAGTGPSAAPVGAAEPGPRRGPSSVAQVFGPGATLGEMFAYLGGAFLLAAFEAFIVRLGGSGDRARARDRRGRRRCRAGPRQARRLPQGWP